MEETTRESFDPTPRTVDAIAREMSFIRELFETWKASNQEAIKLLQDKADSMPTPALVQASVDAFDIKFETKLDGIQQQLNDLKFNIAETSKERKTAIDAAFQAADKAVTERNTSTSDQLKIIQGMISAIDGRVIRTEEKLGNINIQKTDNQTSHDNILSYLAIAISIALPFILVYIK